MAGANSGAVGALLCDDASGNATTTACAVPTVSTSWSSIVAPTGDLSLAMGNYQSTFTWTTAGPTENFTFSSPGLFAATGWNYPVNSTINGAVSSTIRNHMSSAYPSDVAVSGAIIVPSGALGAEWTAVSGVVQNSGATAASVGVFGGSLAKAAGAIVFGMNSISADYDAIAGTHVAAGAVVGHEIDMNIQDASTYEAWALSIGGYAGGTPHTGSSDASYGIFLNGIGVAPWKYPIFLTQGAGNPHGIFIDALGPCSGACFNANSMPIEFWARDGSGGPQPASIQADQTAAFVVTAASGLKLPYGHIQSGLMVGTGNASACVNAAGQLYRGAPGC